MGVGLQPVTRVCNYSTGTLAKLEQMFGIDVRSLAALRIGAALPDIVTAMLSHLSLGVRDLTLSPSVTIAGEKAGVAAGGFDIAELHAPFSHQEIIVRNALGLGEDVDVNPSGGPLAANPMMVAGLTRLGEAASRITAGDASRGVAHATSGPCLQQNLVCVLEAD